MRHAHAGCRLHNASIHAVEACKEVSQQQILVVDYQRHNGGFPTKPCHRDQQRQQRKAGDGVDHGKQIQQYPRQRL